MELTPEQRQQIYLEEKARLEQMDADSGRPATVRKNARIRLNWVIVTLILLVLGVVYVSSRAQKPLSDAEIRASNDKVQEMQAKMRAEYKPIVKPLELVDFSWRTEYGYAILEGQVKNVSQEPLKNVEVVASFYTANGDFITSDDALIAYNPILPGQTSPFRTSATENPAMKKAGVAFKELMGGTIPFEKAERKTTKKE